MESVAQIIFAQMLALIQLRAGEQPENNKDNQQQDGKPDNKRRVFTRPESKYLLSSCFSDSPRLDRRPNQFVSESKEHLCNATQPKAAARNNPEVFGEKAETPKHLQGGFIQRSNSEEFINESIENEYYKIVREFIKRLSEISKKHEINRDYEKFRFNRGSENYRRSEFVNKEIGNYGRICGRSIHVY